MHLIVESRGASAEALDAGAAAALAVFQRADVDPYKAMTARGRIAMWDEAGFPEDDEPWPMLAAPILGEQDIDDVFPDRQKPTPDEFAAAQACSAAEGAAANAVHSMLAEGAQPQQVYLSMGPRTESLAQELRYQIGFWLTEAVDDAEALLEVVRSGGLSATVKRPASGPQIEVNLDRASGPLARFGVALPEDALSDAVVEIARRFHSSLPQEATTDEVLAILQGNHRAAWTFIRFQLDSVPAATDEAARKLDSSIGRLRSASRNFR